MKALKIFIGAVFVLGLLLLVWTYVPPKAEPPNFARILERSGLAYAQNPVVRHWKTEISGPFSSNQVTLVEFELFENITCPNDGSYSKSPEGIDRLAADIRGTFVAGASVCWKSTDGNVSHTYVVHNRRLVYQLVVN